MGMLPRVGEQAEVDDAAATVETTVELWAAALPKPLAPLAWHYWFVVAAPETKNVRTRFEVWQTRRAGGTSAGHVHRGLMKPESTVGHGRSKRRSVWTGDAARALADVLLASLTNYPYRERYAAWPGPNSNTYVSWALHEAARQYPPLAADACALLDPRAVGKDWSGRYGMGAGRLPCGHGWRLASPILGMRAWRSGRAWTVETSLFGLTLFGAEAGASASPHPAALLTPLGRVPLGRAQAISAARTAKSRNVSV